MCKQGRGRDWVAKSMRKKGMKKHPIPVKKPVSNKKPSLISSTHAIQKNKTDATHTQVHSVDLFFVTALNIFQEKEPANASKTHLTFFHFAMRFPSFHHSLTKQA